MGCRKRNHNESEGRLFARQGTTGSAKTPLVLGLGRQQHPRYETGCVDLDLDRSGRAERFLLSPTLPSPWSKVSSFSGAAPGHMTLGHDHLFLLKHIWHWDFSSHRFSRVQMTAQNIITFQKLQILRMWAFMFIRITNILQGMSPKGAFFFFFPFNIVPWGVNPKSHPSESLWKTGQSQLIWQFRNSLVPITKFLCPTTQWSLKQLNVTIWLTRTHARVHTRSHRNCDQGIKQVNLWLCSKRKWDLKTEVSYSSIQKCRDSLRSHLILWPWEIILI